VNMRLLIQTNNLTYQSLGVYALGWVLFVIFGLVHSLYPFSSFFSQIEFDYLAIHNRVLASINGHLVQLLVVFVALLPDIVAKYANRTFRGRAVSLCIVLSKNPHLYILISVSVSVPISTSVSVPIFVAISESMCISTLHLHPFRCVHLFYIYTSIMYNMPVFISTFVSNSRSNKRALLHTHSLNVRVADTSHILIAGACSQGAGHRIWFWSLKLVNRCRICQ
jgi:hypothetical protein